MPLALLSCYNKAGVVDFARGLRELGWDLLSSGGTAKVIREAGLPVTDVAEWVGGSATEGHLVVTLSREVHTALLSQNNAEIEAMGVRRIDLVCCDMYPLREEIAKPGATRQSVIDKTDIGGPTMIRSGAKGGRIVICDPADRPIVLKHLKAGPLTEEVIQALAAKAEFVVARYVLSSALYHGHGVGQGFIGARVAECRYGENAWQTPAGLYSCGTDDPLALDQFQLVAGTAPSYNNYCDLERLLQTMTHLAAAYDVNCGRVPAIAIGVKHGNPCGAGEGLEIQAAANPDIVAAQQMVAGDKRALFGGFVMVNFPVVDLMADMILTSGTSERRILDGIVAPSFTEEAITMLRRKGDKCRFLTNPALANLGRESLDRALRFRYVRGGFLVQPNYTQVPGLNWACAEIVTRSLLDLTPAIVEDLLLAWAIGSTSNSNTITLVKDGTLIGNGVGQQDRVSCCQLAISRAREAGHETTGAVAYSDSFFPFPDGPETLANAGIKAIMASSGSVKDAEVKQFCREHGVILILYPDAEVRGFFGH